jgi:hypothetical protein
MIKTTIAALALMAFAWAPREAAAQKVFKGDYYNITFSAGWDTVGNSAILRKNLGFSGMATLGATPGSGLPNVDSLSNDYSESLGGKITKDSSGVKTLGKYEVHWQKFTYDSLPGLSKIIGAAMGDTLFQLSKGSFRVYYLAADGYRFTIAGMRIYDLGNFPYPDIETAIKTLKLAANSGIVPLARGNVGGLWVQDGKLGGPWLKANRVFAVECYDVRGSLIGHATHAAEGTWALPKTGSEMLVRLRTAQGAGMHFLVRP